MPAVTKRENKWQWLVCCWQYMVTAVDVTSVVNTVDCSRCLALCTAQWLIGYYKSLLSVMGQTAQLSVFCFGTVACEVATDSWDYLTVRPRILVLLLNLLPQHFLKSQMLNLILRMKKSYKSTDWLQWNGDQLWKIPTFTALCMLNILKDMIL